KCSVTCGVTVVNSTTATATLRITPAAAIGDRNLTLNTPAGTTGPVSFTVTPAATLSLGYPDFSNAAGLQLNGTATQVGTAACPARTCAIQLTANEVNDRGTAWYNTPVNV